MKTSVQKNTYSASDISEYLGLSLVGAYNLMHAKDFPSFRIGRRVLVTKQAFDKWLEEKQSKRI
jgi:excisionase family DNA binding protein